MPYDRGILSFLDPIYLTADLHGFRYNFKLLALPFSGLFSGNNTEYTFGSRAAE